MVPFHLLQLLTYQRAVVLLGVGPVTRQDSGFHLARSVPGKGKLTRYICTGKKWIFDSTRHVARGAG
jgi:hypothetical protein